MSSVAVAKEVAVARPLKVLIPLIQQDFDDAEHAGKPFYERAGDKLVEARDGHFSGNISGFYSWAENAFHKTRAAIRTCVGYSTSGGAKHFRNQEDFKTAPKSKGGLGYNISSMRREWTAPVDDIAQKAQKEARRLIVVDDMTKRQEREAEAKLGLRMIEIGYKVLAKELHPDKIGGNREAMILLNRARDRLKACV